MYTQYFLFLVKYGEGSNLTSLLLVEVFAEVAEVNTKALNIKSCQPRQKHCRGKAEVNVFSYSYLGILLPQQKMLKFEAWFYVQKYIMIQFNHLIFTIHNYFIKLNPFSKKCPIHNTELRGYFCVFCIPLCKVLLCYKFKNLQKFFIYSKYGLL